MSILKRKLHILSAFAVLALLVGAVSCKGFFVDPTLSSLTVGPNPLNLTQGTQQQMTATGTYSDGSTKTLTSGIVWSSSDTTVAPISSTGKVTAASSGTATITAQSGTVSGTGTVNVTLGNVTNLAMNPTSGSTNSTGSFTFHAMATIQGQSSPVDVSSTATWTASPSGDVTINNTNQVGAVVTPVASALTAPTTVVTVTATYNSNGTNFTANAQLTITNP
jgi:trimeric autotransporter adhesin